MNYAIANRNIVTIWGAASETETVDGQIRSSIADETLYGMGLAVTGEEEDGFLPVRTHYGYPGYVKCEDILEVSLDELQQWEESELMVISGICVDITSIPKVQGVILCSLFRGALVRVEKFSCEEQDGWAKVVLADGRTGYMRNQFLAEKQFSQSGLWEQKLPQPFLSRLCKAERTGDADVLTDGQGSLRSRLEAQFRDAVVDTAMTYLGVQYRWGGKSTAGIDCSGLTSTSYMMNGVLTFRDAQIKEGFPVHEIPREQMKKGDLLYFPGHIAMCIGGQKYIHSTGKIGSGGVVINSLDPKDEDYREDLVKCLYAVGSIF